MNFNNVNHSSLYTNIGLAYAAQRATSQVKSDITGDLPSELPTTILESGLKVQESKEQSLAEQQTRASNRHLLESGDENTSVGESDELEEDEELEGDMDSFSVEGSDSEKDAYVPGGLEFSSSPNAALGTGYFQSMGDLGFRIGEYPEMSLARQLGGIKLAGFLSQFAVRFYLGLDNVSNKQSETLFTTWFSFKLQDPLTNIVLHTATKWWEDGKTMSKDELARTIQSDLERLKSLDPDLKTYNTMVSYLGIANFSWSDPEICVVMTDLVNEFVTTMKANPQSFNTVEQFLQACGNNKEIISQGIATGVLVYGSNAAKIQELTRQLGSHQDVMLNQVAYFTSFLNSIEGDPQAGEKLTNFITRLTSLFENPQIAGKALDLANQTLALPNIDQTIDTIDSITQRVTELSNDHPEISGMLNKVMISLAPVVTNPISLSVSLAALKTRLSLLEAATEKTPESLQKITLLRTEIELLELIKADQQKQEVLGAYTGVREPVQSDMLNRVCSSLERWLDSWEESNKKIVGRAVNGSLYYVTTYGSNFAHPFVDQLGKEIGNGVVNLSIAVAQGNIIAPDATVKDIAGTLIANPYNAVKSSTMHALINGLGTIAVNYGKTYIPAPLRGGVIDSLITFSSLKTVGGAALQVYAAEDRAQVLGSVALSVGTDLLVNAGVSRAVASMFPIPSSDAISQLSAPYLQELATSIANTIVGRIARSAAPVVANYTTSTASRLLGRNPTES